MLTTSVCTAPLWRRIPHGEHVSRLHAADKVMTALHTLLYITLGKVHLRKQRDLRGKKHDSSQKVPHVPINPSALAQTRAGSQQHGGSGTCQCNSCNSHLQ